MGDKIKIRNHEPDGDGIGVGKSAWFLCPGCNVLHRVAVTGRNKWDWNGSTEAPTFMPSVKVTYGDKRVCHSFIKDGHIQFLSDCYHDKAGKTVEMDDVDGGAL